MIVEMMQWGEELASKSERRNELRQSFKWHVQQWHKTSKRMRQRMKFIPHFAGILRTKYRVNNFLRYGDMELSRDDEIRLTQMRIIRKHLGKCEDTKCYSLESAANRLIRVHLDVGDVNMRVSFLTTLPDDAPCKIVETKSHDLVCGI